MSEPAEAVELRSRYGVSRETTERLEALVALLFTWNRRINLVGRNTETAVWYRHVLDSAQLWPLRPPSARTWVDLGAGAGFPGLVIALLAQELDPDVSVTLVESDQRKVAFLGTATRSLGLGAVVCAERIEVCAPFHCDVLSARALAPLARLLEMTSTHRAPGGIGLFPKGETVHKELAEAARSWRFEHRLHRSLTEPAAAIVEVGALARV